MDVFSDLTRRYDINLNRVVLSGMSMGGIGRFRIGEDYPDRFVAVVPTSVRTPVLSSSTSMPPALSKT